MFYKLEILYTNIRLIHTAVKSIIKKKLPNVIIAPNSMNNILRTIFIKISCMIEINIYSKVLEYNVLCISSAL